MAKSKIETAVNIMRMYNEKITIYSVAKEAKVSYNTASKYKDFILKNS
jgi:predicted transcriptional regulator